MLGKGVQSINLKSMALGTNQITFNFIVIIHNGKTLIIENQEKGHEKYTTKNQLVKMINESPFLKQIC
jgi:hypothetical protein